MKKLFCVLTFCLGFVGAAWADNYAVIDQNNNVVNVIEYDGKSDYNPGKGLKLVKVDRTDQNVERGGTYDPDEETFTRAPHPEPPVDHPTHTPSLPPQ